MASFIDSPFYFSIIGVHSQDLQYIDHIFNNALQAKLILFVVGNFYILRRD